MLYEWTFNAYGCVVFLLYFFISKNGFLKMLVLNMHLSKQNKGTNLCLGFVSNNIPVLLVSYDWLLILFICFEHLFHVGCLAGEERIGISWKFDKGILIMPTTLTCLRIPFTPWDMWAQPLYLVVVQKAGYATDMLTDKRQCSITKESRFTWTQMGYKCISGKHYWY